VPQPAASTPEPPPSGGARLSTDASLALPDELLAQPAQASAAPLALTRKRRRSKLDSIVAVVADGMGPAREMR
jgi:hypothetical protein